MLLGLLMSVQHFSCSLKYEVRSRCGENDLGMLHVTSKYEAYEQRMDNDSGEPLQST
jgi:hypothetical protein